MTGLTDGAIRARTDPEYRNIFLQENKRFILSRAYKAVGHYVTESDDEWSVALLAFNESIDKFEEDKGAFEAFATLLIRRRLYDHLRKENRFSQEIALEPYAMDSDDTRDGEEASSLAMEVRQKTAEMAQETRSTDIKDEIEEIGKLLSRYGFTFMELADSSPKAKKTKQGCADVVCAILRNDDWFLRLRSQGVLPVQDIVNGTGVSKKLLERHRKYIIAAAEIMKGDFPMLAEYMSFIRKAMVD